MPTIYTVGHSTHDIAEFVSLLMAHGIGAVADVRSSPFSRFNPQFNRENLQPELARHGIRYVFLGRELGARSTDPACYERGRVVYDRLAQTPLFRTGLDRVLGGAAKFKIALMCAEKEPLDCHRTILVATELINAGADIAHIHADASVEPHESALRRLMRQVGIPEADLFRDRDELVREALRRQEVRIAYVDSDNTSIRAPEGKP